MDFHWGIAFFLFGKKVIPVAYPALGHFPGKTNRSD
jgi:hypothetical protein